MAKKIDRGGFGWWGLFVLAIGVTPSASGHSPAAQPVAVVESRSLADAERMLAMGQTDEAARIYREAFFSASGLEERLALVGPLARVLLVNQELDDWLDQLQGPFGGGGEWEWPLLRAAVFQFLGDLSAADEELVEMDQSALPEELSRSLVRQRRAWAEEKGDRKTILALYADAEDDGLLAVGGAEEHFNYVETLIRSRAKDEMEAHLRGRSAKLAGEAEFWRLFLPDLKEEGLLDLASLYLENAWEAEAAGPVVRFALAELRLFQGRTAEAEAIFWTIFEMEEETGAVDGDYFRRLNAYLHNRFPVKYRVDQATGRYRSKDARDFLLFGFSSDVEVGGIRTARDLSLLYLREILLPVRPTGQFLDQVGDALNRGNHPWGVRILAFAGLGAPKPMLEEVRGFARASERNTGTAEFALQAMNRYVLSSKKFPQILEPLADLTRAMGEKYAEVGSSGPPGGIQALQGGILRRLGEKDTGQELSASIRERYFERIGRAAETGKPEEAERLFRLLTAEEPGEDLRSVLLFLANAWQAGEGAGQAAALVAEFLEPVHSRKGGGGMFAPLQWRSGMPFPPPNPYFGETGFEMLQNAYEVVAGKDSEAQLKRILRADLEVAEDNRAGRALALASLHWWSGEADAAVEALRGGGGGGEDPGVQVLLGYLLGLTGELGRGREILEAIGAESGEASVASQRLLFAFAVAEQDGERAEEKARDLEKITDGPSEKVEVASSLVGIGREAEARRWLEAVVPDDLAGRERGLYQELWLRVLMSAEERVAAVAQARWILLGEQVNSLAVLGDEPRRAALVVLEQAGETENYQNYLETLWVVAPQALGLHILLGEVLDFQASGRADDEHERDRLREQASRYFRKGADLRPDDLDFRLSVCHWLGANGFDRDAVVEFRTVMARDVQSVLLDFRTVLEVFGRAAELPWLVAFFEEWEVPEVRSMDDFYGLQPTEHLLRPLGEALLAQGNRADAIRAWKTGLRINPIGFTEELRLMLARLHRETGDDAALLDLLKGYVTEDNADSHLYAIQPFFDVAPRWIHIANSSQELAAAPVNRLVSLAEQQIGASELRRVAEEWRVSMPDRLSASAFGLYLAARGDVEGWEEAAGRARNAFATGEGPLPAAWAAVEALLARVAENEFGK